MQGSCFIYLHNSTLQIPRNYDDNASFPVYNFESRSLSLSLSVFPVTGQTPE
jgi:hypothetical protein